MKIELPPQYDPKSVETAIYKKWLDAASFHAVPDARQNKFSIVIPPPNVTGALHLGHAINGTIQDIQTRYHRMKGDNTMWIPGIDHAGIATQAVVERTIFEKEKKSRHDLGREELVRRIWEWKEQYGNRILNQLQSIGNSCDWDRTRFTLDDTCAKAVREAFFRMFKDGLIFRGKRLVNWDVHLQTAVADDEIYHETVKGQMTSIKYPVDGAPGEYLIVATTRPETMLGDTAVAVHPDDPRYTHLHGKFVIVPLVGRKIPIVCDGLLVDPKFGTGVVKVTPAHDPNDYATGQRHKLEMINLLTADGKVNEHGQGEFLGTKYSYTGLKFASEARKHVLADLEKLGLIAEVKVHEHEVGHSDRSKTPIEPYLSDQWFVRMGDSEQGIKLADGTQKSGLAQAAMDAVIDGRVKITPDRYAKGYLDWLGQKRDWCISRQLWWGHRIPVWHIQQSQPGPILTLLFACGLEDKFYWADNCQGPFICTKDAEGDRVLGIIGEVIAGHITASDAVAKLPIRVDVPDKLKLVEAVARFVTYLTQDPDVLDTWFSSALWPISTMGWPANGTSDKPEDQLLPYFYPTSLLSTARDILTLWVARMVMFGLYCRGDVPFKHVYVHATIQDGEGRTMSKSKGNGVDPVDIVDSHGADALRFTLASMVTETQDIRMPVVKDKESGKNTSPKFDIGRNFANKVWNASRFILSNIEETLEVDGAQLIGKELEDKWILARLSETIRTVDEAINTFRLAEYANTLYQFFWNDLCDWYLEIAKARIKAGDADVQKVLLHCLRTALQLLHPMMPFITEEIWSKLPGTKALLISSPFPIYQRSAEREQADNQIVTQMNIGQAVTRLIRDVRNQNNIGSAQILDVIIKPNNPAVEAIINTSRSIIEWLSNAKIVEVSPSAAKPTSAAVVVDTQFELYVPGVIDKDAEAKKLTKRRDDLKKFIAGNQAKLGNEAFVGKAPVKIVQGLKDQLAQQEAELAAVEKNLAAMG